MAGQAQCEEIIMDLNHAGDGGGHKADARFHSRRLDPPGKLDNTLLGLHPDWRPLQRPILVKGIFNRVHQRRVVNNRVRLTPAKKGTTHQQIQRQCDNGNSHQSKCNSLHHSTMNPGRRRCKKE